jgi:drug/metabolite transporter (DMT)-like permease
MSSHPTPDLRADNLRGALLMSAGMGIFAVSDATMKVLGEEMPLLQAMVLRGAGVTLVLALMAWARGARWSEAGGRDRRLMALRALLEAGAAWTYLAALMHMPVANVSAVFQASPLAIVAAGALVLGERVSRARWAAVGVGLLGVLLVVRPGAEGWGWPAALVLTSVAFVTARDLASRALSPGIPSVLVAAVTGAGVTLVALAGALFVDWAPVSGRAALLILLVQVLQVGAYLAVVAGMRRGEVSFVAPFRYTNLLAATLAGWAIFGAFPDALTLLGAGVVVLGGLLMLLGARR